MYLQTPKALHLGIAGVLIQPRLVISPLVVALLPELHQLLNLSDRHTLTLGPLLVREICRQAREPELAT